MDYALYRDQKKSLSGKKFELPKKSNFFPLELVSPNFFLVHKDLEVLQKGHSFQSLFQIMKNGIIE